VSTSPPLTRVAAPQLESLGIEGTFAVHASRADDERGWLAELLRDSWLEPLRFRQVNIVQSRAGTLRGVHWHERHFDFIAPVAGRMLVGLSDLRSGSPTERRSVLLEATSDPLTGVVVPPGVAHGFYSAQPTTALYAMSAEYDGEDEYGVAFDDERLGIDWPVNRAAVMLSPRDAVLPRLGEGHPPPRFRPSAA
jgi:dTDP-4-dehydrorhamnose 3,5-epimerase